MSYTSQQYLVADVTLSANFNVWAGAISAAIASMGWIQCSDTGQAVWTATVLTLTQVAVGTTAVYSYSSYTGPALRVGMSVIITGFGTSGNNVTATLTAVSGGTSGTVTTALTTQANETHAGSGTTTATVYPGANNFSKYEIWKPADALPGFFLRITYGGGGNGGPRVQMRISTGTDGAGNSIGITSNVFETNRNDFSSDGTTLPLECSFCGDTDRLSMMLWRNSPNNNYNLFSIERTKNTDGTNNSEGVTILSIGVWTGASFVTGQQTLVFGVGAAPTTNSRVVVYLIDGLSGGTFNGNIPVSPVFPFYGKYGNPMTTVAVIHAADINDGAFFTTTLYGTTHTYLASAGIQPWSYAASSMKMCMRYD